MADLQSAALPLGEGAGERLPLLQSARSGHFFNAVRTGDFADAAYSRSHIDDKDCSLSRP
jgi:hypothetical protein